MFLIKPSINVQVRLCLGLGRRDYEVSYTSFLGMSLVSAENKPDGRQGRALSESEFVTLAGSQG